MGFAKARAARMAPTARTRAADGGGALTRTRSSLASRSAAAASRAPLTAVPLMLMISSPAFTRPAKIESSST